MAVHSHNSDGIFTKLTRHLFSHDVATQTTKSHNLQTKYYLQTVGQPIWSNRNYHKFAEEGYIKNVIANRCINLISKNAAKVRFKLFRVNGKGERQPLLHHPLLQLLSKPNPLMHQNDFLEQIYNYKIIAGNAFVQATGFMDETQLLHPAELYCLRPDKVEILCGGDSLPMGYRYRVQEKTRDFLVNPLSGHSEILHIKNFNPLDDWYGLSLVEPAIYSIDQHNEANRWNQALLQNGARPSGALVVKGEENGGFLSEEQFLRIKEEFSNEYIGSYNAGKPLLLEGGLDWKEISLSPKDMDFIEIKYSAARDIALSFGVPPQLLGIPGDTTYNNLAEGRLALWEQTIIPIVEDVVNALNSWLTPMFDADLVLSYDEDSISALNIRRESQWSMINSASFLSTDEKRELLGFGKLKTAVLSNAKVATSENSQEKIY